MRLEVNRRGHRWCAIGADVECFWCEETFIAYNSAPFCCSEHRRLWNEKRKPRRPTMATPEQEQEMMRVIAERLGLHQVEQERRSA